MESGKLPNSAYSIAVFVLGFTPSNFLTKFRYTFSITS